uniref:Integrase core domain containing protein n=1 Tax=Solanum tuberosum TaxID=4113 RepID=M1DH23_SOLTU
MPNTRSKGAPLILYDPELQKTIREMVNTQEIEAQRQRLGLEAKTVARVCGGSFMRKPFSESMQLMDEVSKNNRAWYTRDAEVGDLGFTFKLSAKQMKREEEMDQDMTHMRTQIDLLTKHIIASFEKVNVVGPPNRYEDQDIDLDEEAKYLGNKGGFQNYNSGNQGYNSGNAGRNYSREGQYHRPANREQGTWKNKDGYRNDCSGRALVDVESGELKFRLNKEKVKFKIYRSMKLQQDMNVVSAIEAFDEEEMGATIEERLAVETLAVVLMNFEANFRTDYVETVLWLPEERTQPHLPHQPFLSQKENITTTPPTVDTEAETRAQEEVGDVGEDEEITTDETMVQYVNIHEVDPAARQQLIDCFCLMWIVNRSEDFFNNGIVTKSGGFKKRPIMLRPEWWWLISNHSPTFIGYFSFINLTG